MSDPTAQRTLVKSPPELWAEVSDAESLARHLGEFGDIKITRVEPESTVVWEGDRARGTVQIEPSGWGTKVTLTATPTDEAEPEPAAVVPEPEPEPVAVVPEPEPEPAAVVPEPEPEPVAVAPEPEPVALEPEPEPVAVEPHTVAATEYLARSGFFSRMFGRRPEPLAATPTEPPAAPPVAETPEPPNIAPVPEPEPEPEPEPPAAPEPDPLPEPTPLPERPEPEPPAAARADTLDSERVAGLLTDALESLGSAHHRPFSRQ